MTVRSQKSEDDRRTPGNGAPGKAFPLNDVATVVPESEEGPGIPPKSGALERHFLAGTIEDLFDVNHR
jgi:hypothetical protein